MHLSFETSWIGTKFGEDIRGFQTMYAKDCDFSSIVTMRLTFVSQQLLYGKLTIPSLGLPATCVQNVQCETTVSKELT